MHLNTLRSPTAAPHWRGGFSLIEFIGVLAILSILAAVTLPSIVQRVDQAAWTREVCDLGAISNALVLQIVQNKTIPNATNWAQGAANWLDLPLNRLTNNPRGYARAYLIDTNGWLGSLGPSLSYTNANGTTNPPTSARVMLLSSLSCPLPVASGRPAAASFNEIWSTEPGSKPASWSTWAGSGEDLLIQRLNLQPLFHRLILLDRDTDGSGQFQIDGGAPRSVPTNGVGRSAFHLVGTVLDLVSNNVFTPSTNLQARMLLKEDVSYVYERGSWQDQIQSTVLTNTLNTAASVPAADAFAATVAQFLNANLVPVSHNAATQVGVVNFMYTYMWSYAQWANDSPCFGVGMNGNPNQSANYLLMQECWADLNSYANWLLGN